MISGIHYHVLVSQAWAAKAGTFLQLQGSAPTQLTELLQRKGGLGVPSVTSRQNKVTEGKGSCCHIESGLNCGIWKLRKRCYIRLAWTLDTEVERKGLCLVISPCSLSG